MLKYQDYLEQKKKELPLDKYFSFEEDFLVRAFRLGKQNKVSIQEAADVLANFMNKKEFETMMDSESPF